jgi:hypothetical protein
MKKMLALVTALMFTGCASFGTVSVPKGIVTVESRIEMLKKFTAQDAQTALDHATAAQDKPAVQCLNYLVPKIKALAVAGETPAGTVQVPGALTVTEDVRIAIHSNTAQDGFLADLDLNCAALRTSIEMDIARGAVLAAGASTGAGAVPAVLQTNALLLKLLAPQGL